MASPTITLRVPKDTNEALSNVAEATGKPVGELVRDGIDMLLAQYDPEALLDLLHETRVARDEATRAALTAAKEARKVADGGTPTL